MKQGIVPSSWLSITNAMSAQVNLNLLEEVNKRGIDHADFPAVKACWKEMQAKAAADLVAEQEAAHAREIERRVAGAKSVTKIADIKGKFPSLQWKK